MKAPIRPDCYRHFISRFKKSSPDQVKIIQSNKIKSFSLVFLGVTAHLKNFFNQAAVAPKPEEECIKLKAVIGYNGNGRGNMVWSLKQGYHTQGLCTRIHF